MGSYSNSSALTPSSTISTGITLPAGAYPTAIQFIPASAISLSGTRSGAMTQPGKIRLSVAPTNSTTSYNATTGDLATVTVGAKNTTWTATIAAGTYSFSNANSSYPFIGNTAYAGCTIYIVIKRVGVKYVGGNFTIPVGKLVVTTTSKYTGVVSGNLIKATDRSQTGTTTTAGTAISDSHFTAGTSAAAGTFNTKVLDF